MSADVAVERRRVLPALDVVLLRATVVLGAAVAAVAAQAAGGRPALWQQLLLLALALWTAVRPESVAGVATILVAAYLWATAGDPGSPLVLLAAAGLLLVHVAALLAAQGPARLRVDLVQVRRWAVRAVLLWLLAAGVWGLARALEDLPERRLAYAVGLTVLTVLAVAGTGLLGTRRTRTREETSGRLSRRRGAAGSP